MTSQTRASIAAGRAPLALPRSSGTTTPIIPGELLLDDEHTGCLRGRGHHDGGSHWSHWGQKRAEERPEWVANLIESRHQSDAGGHGDVPQTARAGACATTIPAPVVFDDATEVIGWLLAETKAQPRLSPRSGAGRDLVLHVCCFVVASGNRCALIHQTSQRTSRGSHAVHGPPRPRGAARACPSAAPQAQGTTPWPRRGPHVARHASACGPYVAHGAPHVAPPAPHVARAACVLFLATQYY